MATKRRDSDIAIKSILTLLLSPSHLFCRDLVGEIATELKLPKSATIVHGGQLEIPIRFHNNVKASRGPRD